MVMTTVILSLRSLIILFTPGEFLDEADQTVGHQSKHNEAKQTRQYDLHFNTPTP